MACRYRPDRCIIAAPSPLRTAGGRPLPPMPPMTPTSPFPGTEALSDMASPSADKILCHMGVQVGGWVGGWRRSRGMGHMGVQVEKID